ncbi:hypothetical protein HYC85_000602 [Camellia sinensis]|uniref:Transmembrane protein n=1 Tax=Camellia sinensis TaxID=4442 RepID=A0A7J7I2Z8_CAMSI|nr:hypothetical protein HYC85_000602 [Camellia sinensis]
MNENIKVAIIAALVGFAGIIAAALFAALCTLENQHVGSKKLILKFQDILDPNKWPSHFLLIVSLTIGFTVSLVVAVVSIWRMIMERSFCYRARVCCCVCILFRLWFYVEGKGAKLHLRYHSRVLGGVATWLFFGPLGNCNIGCDIGDSTPN